MTLSEASKRVLVQRLKSFAWRAGGMFAVATVEFLADNIGLFELPPSVIVVVGLMLGELTKFIKVNLPQLRAGADQPSDQPPQ